MVTIVVVQQCGFSGICHDGSENLYTARFTSAGVAWLSCRVLYNERILSFTRDEPIGHPRMLGK